MRTVQNITTAGAGVMGSQVAWMAAWHGKTVAVYDAFDAGLEKGKGFHAQYAQHFLDRRGATPAQVRAAQGRLRYTSDLADALQGAELVIEQVPENLEIKKDFWAKVSQLASAQTIFCTNTSSLLPSAIAPAVAHPERFLTLHFCVDVWEANVGEVMLTPQTDPKYLDIVCAFARQMGLVPVPIRKEQPGYVLNSLLIPWGVCALALLKDGIATPATIDRVWRICMDAEIGPLQMIDKAGLNVMHHVVQNAAEAGDHHMAEIARMLKTQYLDKGRAGALAGAGFYDYPNPAFEQKDFLAGND